MLKACHPMSSTGSPEKLTAAFRGLQVKPAMTIILFSF